MQEKKFQFSGGFVNKLIELTEGRLTSDQFEAVLSSLEAETSEFYFTPSSEANLLRIISSIHDKIFFFQEILKYPHHSEILIAISASSNYLSDIVVRNPEYLYQIFDQNYLSKKFEYDFFKKEITEGVVKFHSLNAKLNFLRRIKKRFILKIGLADILGMCQLQSTTEQLSYLAKSINSTLFEICYREILQKYNLENLVHNYCLCSLGKLGGNELNYCSDVDLLLFYDFNEPVTSGKEFHEILSEAAQMFIKSSTDISDHGYIYRVDFRLRPDGKYSPLCKTMVDYTRYYEARGEDWERQMLIKLDFIYGDEKLYKQFYDFVQLYVYPASFSTSIKDKIKQMKFNIEKHMTEKDNVKTFTGGIRDIEFTVQALQLINGGKIKSVRARNTLEAISSLADCRLFSLNEKKILTNAYIFYRRIEHFLQLMNDRQTHLIPEENELLYKMINYLGFKTRDEFRQQLKSYRENVRNIYHKILKTEKDFSPRIKEPVKFKDPVKAEKNFNFLSRGIGLIDRKEFDSRTIELFDSIQPTIIKSLSKLINPDIALENFAKIIRSTKFPSIWYSELANKKFLNHFLEYCLYSQKSVDSISINKLFEEYFLSRQIFDKNILNITNHQGIDEIIFLLSTRFSFGLINPVKLSRYLSDIKKKKIKSISFQASLNYKFFIGGLGSFGAGNMNFASDVDLIIVAEEIESVPTIQKDFQNLCNVYNTTIKPFQVDFKLRPEGKSSQLVWGLNNYGEYLAKRARIWEFQSLQKLKFIYGDETIYQKFRECVNQKIKSLNKKELQKEIRNMYSLIQKQNNHETLNIFNIKKSRGGLLTLDFILQSICLSNPQIYIKSMGKTFLEMLSFAKNKFAANDYIAIKNNFTFLKQIEVSIQNIFNSNGVNIPNDMEKRTMLASFLKFSEASGFDNKIKSTINTNNKLFEKYVCV